MQHPEEKELKNQSARTVPESFISLAPPEGEPMDIGIPLKERGLPRLIVTEESLASETAGAQDDHEQLINAHFPKKEKMSPERIDALKQDKQRYRVMGNDFVRCGGISFTVLAGRRLENFPFIQGNKFFHGEDAFAAIKLAGISGSPVEMAQYLANALALLDERYRRYKNRDHRHHGACLASALLYTSPEGERFIIGANLGDAHLCFVDEDDKITWLSRIHRPVIKDELFRLLSMKKQCHHLKPEKLKSEISVSGSFGELEEHYDAGVRSIPSVTCFKVPDKSEGRLVLFTDGCEPAFSGPDGVEKIAELIKGNQKSTPALLAELGKYTRDDTTIAIIPMSLVTNKEMVLATIGDGHHDNGQHARGMVRDLPRLFIDCAKHGNEPEFLKRFKAVNGDDMVREQKSLSDTYQAALQSPEFISFLERSVGKEHGAFLLLNQINKDGWNPMSARAFVSHFNSGSTEGIIHILHFCSLLQNEQEGLLRNYQGHWKEELEGAKEGYENAEEKIRRMFLRVPRQNVERVEKALEQLESGSAELFDLATIKGVMVFAQQPPVCLQDILIKVGALEGPSLEFESSDEEDAKKPQQQGRFFPPAKEKEKATTEEPTKPAQKIG